MYNRKTWKTLLALTLTVGMFFSLGGAAAFAEIDTDDATYYYVDEGSAASEDSLTLTSPGYSDVITVTADDGESSSLTVAGDVTVTGDGDWSVWAVNLYPAGEGAETTMTVGGDLTATSEAGNAEAVYIWADSTGAANLTVDGNVTATAAEDATAVYVNANGGSTVDVRVGDVTASGEDYSTGISGGAYGEGSTFTVTAGSVTAEGGESYGVGLGAGMGTVTATFNGDVSGDTCGAALYAADDGSVDFTADGTVSGGEAAIGLGYLGEDTGEVSITAWKLESDGDALVVAEDYGFNGYTDEELEAYAAEVEAAINYIIRLEQPEQAALSGTTQIHGFDTAKEGETVTLTAKGGYRIVSASNNGAALLQDANGNFFIVVPKGGGVSLSVLAELIAAAKAAVGKSELTTADGVKIELTFYDDGAFKLVVGDGEEIVRGHAKVVDGKLVLVNGHGVECPVADDGTVKFQKGRTEDSIIEFKMDLELVAQLIEMLS